MKLVEKLLFALTCIERFVFCFFEGWSTRDVDTSVIAWRLRKLKFYSRLFRANIPLLFTLLFPHDY